MPTDLPPIGRLEQYGPLLGVEGLSVAFLRLLVLDARRPGRHGESARAFLRSANGRAFVARLAETYNVEIDLHSWLTQASQVKGAKNEQADG